MALLCAGDTSGYIWSAFDAISAVRYGPDWTNNIISPETNVLTDIAAGTLAQVTFIVPDKANSDHAGAPQGGGGPYWVGSIVNTIAQSQFWSSTAIIVTWDDWGGWYDHVPPPCSIGYACDAMGPGFRVPLLVISPYAKTGYVSHQMYDIASIPASIEQRFGLAPLTNADANAQSFWNDCFIFNQQARGQQSLMQRRGLQARVQQTYRPPLIRTKLKAADFLRRPHSYEPPDE